MKRKTDKMIKTIFYWLVMITAIVAQVFLILTVWHYG